MSRDWSKNSKMSKFEVLSTLFRRRSIGLPMYSDVRLCVEQLWKLENSCAGAVGLCSSPRTYVRTKFSIDLELRILIRRDIFTCTDNK